MLEVIVQARRPYIAEEGGWVLAIEVPDDYPVERVRRDELGGDWRDPARDRSTQLLGERSFAAGAGGVWVPSAWNLILNPRHRRASELRLASSTELELDRRLAR